MSTAFGEITMTVLASRLQDVKSVLEALLPSGVFSSCSTTNMTADNFDMVLTFPGITRETLKAIEAVTEAAWPGRLDARANAIGARWHEEDKLIPFGGKPSETP